MRAARWTSVVGVLIVSLIAGPTATTASAAALNPAHDPPAYFQTAHSPTIYTVEQDTRSVRAVSYQEWARAGHPVPSPTRTDYVKYPWSDTVYAVTFWFPEESAWQWDRLTMDEWSRAGFPPPRHAGWIAGSVVYQWQSCDELFVQGQDGSKHKLTFEEWALMGLHSFEKRPEGFFRGSPSSPPILFRNVVTGESRTISYEEWVAEDFPSPMVWGAPCIR